MLTLESKFRSIEIIVFTAVCSSIIFFLTTFLFKFTLSTDDYQFLADILSPSGWRFDVTNHYFARVPIWYVITWLNFHLFDWSQNFYGMYFFFFIHALAFALLSFYAVKTLKLNVSTPIFIIVTTLFSLYPTHYEILYWPTCMAYTFGLLFLALALLSKSTILKIILLSLSFGTSEMFLIPSLLFLLLPNIFKFKLSPKDFHELFLKATPWLAAIVIDFGLQYLNSKFVSTFYKFPINFNFTHVISNILDAEKMVLTLNFYQLYNRTSLIIWLILLSITVSLIWRKKISFKTSVVLLLSIIAATAVYWPLTYYAARALYGAQIYANIIELIILIIFLEKYHWHQSIIIATLFIFFIKQSLFIYQLKTYNYYILQARQNELTNTFNACTEPNIVELKNLDYNLQTDWVLHQDFWISFAQWVKEKNNINKNIKFNIIKDN